MVRPRVLLAVLCWTLLWRVYTPAVAAEPVPAASQDPILLRAWGVPSPFSVAPNYEADRRVIRQFRQKYPWVDLANPAGLVLPGGRAQDMVPLMQVAGGIAPDVLYINFRLSQTYIAKKLLYPLDHYVEKLAQADIPDGSALSNQAYIDALSHGARWDLIQQRVPAQCWSVMRRACPYGSDCPYRRQWGLEPRSDHRHIWAYPAGPKVVGIRYDKSLLAEHAAEGVEVRAPRTWEEMIQWAKIINRPDRNEFGMELRLELAGWDFMQLLYGAGGQAVMEDAQGNWVCTLDSDAAVEAAFFYARLRLEPVRRGDRVYHGVSAPAAVFPGSSRFAFVFTYIDERFLSAADQQTIGIGPVPAGPTGLQRSEFNSAMCGLFSGLADDDRRRDAAWEYLQFFDGPEARRIRTQTLVEAGLGQLVRPSLLQQFNDDGRYDAILRQIPPEVEETYRIALEGGVPEPYGKNCQFIHTEMNKPIGAIYASSIVRAAIESGDHEAGKAEVRRILQDATIRINQKMLGNLPVPVRQRREIIAWVIIALVTIVFTIVFTQVYRTFRAPAASAQIENSAWRRRRYRWAYILLAPALISIGLWAYWPLARGTLIAFQDYSVTGDSTWVGAANFGRVLFDPEFWYSLRVSLTYALLFMLFGFGAPITLAFLLQEVPQGSIVYRTLFYLPAILSGTVVIFLWKSFYAPDGMINQLLNAVVSLLNYLPGVDINPFSSNWLENPTMALFFCLLPTVWAGMGPGCLIYLAALKTIPEELYEAADLDGAGIRQKVFRVALPSIAALVSINFIGAMIGAIRGAGGYMLAMTGGGPYGQSGGATEVIGLKLFYTTFGRLDFGQGAAMAWVLGSMLIGFTVLRLRRLKNMEFRTAEKAK